MSLRRRGIGMVAAREHLRVAHRLVELTRVTEAVAAGELIYSKVRAITSIATPETEGSSSSSPPTSPPATSRRSPRPIEA